MTLDVMKSLEKAGAPAGEFWENDLEIAIMHVFERSNNDGNLNEWIRRRKGRQINVLCETLGIDCDLSVQKKKDKLKLYSDGGLLPYLLVDQFAKQRSKVVVYDFAQNVLDEDILKLCRIDEEDFDKTALLFAIYHLNSGYLCDIFHLDKIHKSGFARMTLKNRIRRPKQSFKEFLQPEVVRNILTAFDKAKGDGRISEYRSVIIHDSHFLVFVRRAERPDLVLQAAKVVHGYRPEWIILDFTDDAKRVNISSVSVSVPLEIANRIASGYFKKACEYENESQITYSKQLELFLKNLINKKGDELSLVEIVVSNSPLDGSPKVKITDPASNPIGPSIRHFEKVIGKILADLENIESIKVHYRKKRVSLLFEKIENKNDEYVVRYSDHRLNALERISFEDHLRSTHGIPVLSTEKRFKR